MSGTTRTAAGNYIGSRILRATTTTTAAPAITAPARRTLLLTSCLTAWVSTAPRTRRPGTATVWALGSEPRPGTSAEPRIRAGATVETDGRYAAGQIPQANTGVHTC